MRRSWQFFLLPSLALCLLSWNNCSRNQVKPYNLILSSDGADPNGFMLNALWGAQFNGLQGNTPGPGPVPLGSPNEPWSSSQTDWVIGSDSGLCGSHKNWDSAGPPLMGGSYTGFLSFESHSGPHPFDDDDYSFNLVPMSLTGGPNGTGLQAHEDHIHVEYDVSEVGDKFDEETPWWHQFHHAIDNSGDRPTPWDMLTSRTATVLGLMGMDTKHPPPQSNGNGGETELHPIWAMAARVIDQPNRDNSVIFRSADETYAFMARNWGNEGFCSSSEWMLPVKTLSIKIPWRQGANQVGIGGQFSIVNPPDSAHPQNNVSVSFVQNSGIFLTFQLIPQPQFVTDQNGQPQFVPPEIDGTITEGELYVHWTGNGLVNSPAAPPPPKSNGENTTGPEAVMHQLAAKMTPQQRASFIAATAMKPIPKHSFSAKLNPAVQLTAPPSAPQSPPKVQGLESPRLTQFEKSRMDALHAIFGSTIPGVVEKQQVSPH